ncbi:MAG: hypothetical protein ACLTDF_02725 [Coprococcus sp.]
MKIDNMRELYEELLRATSNGYRNRSIANPAVDFTKQRPGTLMRCPTKSITRRLIK